MRTRKDVWNEAYWVGFQDGKAHETGYPNRRPDNPFAKQIFDIGEVIEIVQGRTVVDEGVVLQWNPTDDTYLVDWDGQHASWVRG